MSAIVTMTQTSGNYVSGQTYRVRTRVAESLIKASKASLQPERKIKTGNPATSEGK